MTAAQRASPGRPRDSAKDEAILAATRQLLAEVGYHRTTISAIARAAQVNAPAIYRRWPTRLAVVSEAVHGAAGAPLPRECGRLRPDLASWVRVFLVRAARPASRAGVPGLLADAQNDEARERLTATGAPIREAFDRMIRAAEERGEAAPGTDSDLLFELLADSTSMRGLKRGMADAEPYIDSLAGALSVLAAHHDEVAPRMDDE